MIRSLLEWASPLFGEWGYALVAVAILLERAVLLGLVAPGDVVLATAGMFAARKSLDLRWVIAVAFAAGAVAGSIGYWLGRTLGRRLLHRMPFSRRVLGKLDAAERHFRLHGGKTIVVGRFIAGVGAFIPFSAGAAAMSYRKFTAYDLPAVAAWVTGLALLGYFLGHNVDGIDRLISRFGWATLSLLAVVVVARWLIRRRRHDRSSEES